MTDTAIPLVIGVTGHRKLRLEDRPVLQKHFSQLFARFRETYPHTPLILLSPLMPGADQLVAEAALANGVRVVVPLPWELGLDDEALLRGAAPDPFFDLLSRATPLVMRVDEGGRAVDPAQVMKSPEARKDLINALGRFIVRHSQLLIALWDGNGDLQAPDETLGSTACMMKWHAQCAPALHAPEFGMLDTLERGALYTIITPREGGPENARLVFPRWRFFPNRTLPQRLLHFLATHPLRLAGIKRRRSTGPDRTFGHLWRNVELFNRDAARLHAAAAAPVTGTRTEPGIKNPFTSPLRNCHEAADTLADQYRKRFRLTIRTLFALTFAAVFALEVYAHLRPEEHHWLGVYLACMAAGFAVWTLSRSALVQLRYLEYRALADGLRVQYYWRLAGVQAAAADNYLRHLRSELEWVRMALRSLFLCGHMQEGLASKDAAGMDGSTLDVIRRDWLEDAARHYETCAARYGRRARITELVSSWLFLIAIGIVIFLLCFHPPHHHELIVAMFMCVLAAVLGQEYSRVQTHAINERRDDRMASIFTTALQRFDALRTADDHAALRTLLLELGKESLAHSGDWLMQHRHTPVEVPKG